MKSDPRNPAETSAVHVLTAVNPADSPRAAPYIRPEVAALMAVPARVRILVALNERCMSATEYAEEFGEDLTKVARHFRVLHECGYLEVVEMRGGRRGPPQRIFRATQRAIFDTPTWERLPLALRLGYSGTIWETYGRRVTEAIEEGTLDADPKRHFSWSPLLLDQLAWTHLVAGLDAILDWALDLQAEAAERMAETEEEPMPATIGMAGFLSPKTAQNGPPVR